MGRVDAVPWALLLALLVTVNTGQFMAGCITAVSCACGCANQLEMHARYWTCTTLACQKWENSIRKAP